MERTVRGIRLMTTALIVDLAFTAVSPIVQLAILRVAGPDISLALLLTGLVLSGVLGALYLVAFGTLYAGRSERSSVDVRKVRAALGLGIVAAGAAIVSWALQILAYLSTGIFAGGLPLLLLDIVVSVAAGSAFYEAFHGFLDPGWRKYALVAILAGALSAAMPTIVALLLDLATVPADLVVLAEVLAAAGWILGAMSLVTFIMAARFAAARAGASPS